MNSINVFEDLKRQIRPRLKEYLVAQGIELSENGMFMCINPLHSDTNASMKVLTDLNGEQVYCYGCNVKGDIFSAHNWIEDAPVTSLEFIEDNVYKLAERFGIQYEKVQLTPAQLERMEQVRFNRVVSDLLVREDERGKPINWTHKHVEERGWDSPTCKSLRVSTVKNYDKFLKAIKEHTGLEREQIREKGVKSNLFGPDYITITLYDEKDNPIGFTARWLKWEKGKGQKYVNSSHSETFEKRKVLYGMNLARSSNGRRLDIFEGNGSFITAYAAGHKSCVALCGSSITDEQVELIQRMGFTNINLVLDADSTGHKQAEKYMESLSGREGLRVSLTRLSDSPMVQEGDDGVDPDDFIQAYGLGEFFKLSPVSAFEFFIEKEGEQVGTGQVDVLKFVNKMIKIIQNTENRIERGRQIKKLADVAKVSEEDIRSEMDRLTSVQVDAVKEKLSKTISGAKDADDLASIFDEAKRAIEDVGATADQRTKLGTQECVEGLDDLLKILENRESGLQGWRTGFDILDLRLSGIPKPMGRDRLGHSIPIPGSLIGFAGAPQHGKSTLMQNIDLNIALLNDDVTVLHWSLDDSRERTMERMLAMHSGLDWKAITRRIPIDPVQEEKLNESIETFRDLIAQGKLIIKDHNVGSTLPMLMRWTAMMQQQYGRPTLVVIDSFHKIHPTHNEINLTEPARTKKHSGMLKQFAQTHNVTVMASLELNKGASRGQEPDMLSITESRKVEYDFDVIATVFNHYYDMDGESDNVVMSPSGDLQPIVKLNIRKSKEGGTGPVFFTLDPNTFRVRCYSLQEIKSLAGLEERSEIKISGGTISSPDTGGLKSLGTRTEPWSK